MDNSYLLITDLVPFIIDESYRQNIRRTIITETDIEGKCYKKQIAYMENTIRIGTTLIEVISNEPKIVCSVINYIAKNLQYNKNIIELSPRKMLNDIGNTESNISKAISRCKELGIIKKVCEVEGFENVSKKLYTVNHNYIFNGSIQALDEAYKKFKSNK